MKKILISLGSFVSLSLPMLVLAQTTVRTGYLGSIIDGGTALLKKILIFLVALAVVWFIWNVVRYAMSGDEEGKGKAKDQMVWGIIAITVIVSVWGIVALLQNAFGLNEGVTAAKGGFESMIPKN